MTSFAVDTEDWGKLPDGQAVALFTVRNPHGFILRMTNYGARIVSLDMPDRHGKLSNITLGFDRLEDYFKHTAYFGTTVGRYAGRITQGKFTLNGKEYSLSTNNGSNHIHGGVKGFDRQVWKAITFNHANEAGIKFSYTSPDGEEGYPGKLNTTVTYTLTGGNELRMDYVISTDQDTIINLTNHAYWNLNGADSGDILGHELTIAADKYLEMDEKLTSTGKLIDVNGTVFDFNAPHLIGERIEPLKSTVTKGYDLAYALRNQDSKLAFAARVRAPESGRTMEIWTDQPGVVFYTANYLKGDSMNGGYGQHAAFCLETEHYPDSPNHPNFPSTVLRAGKTFGSTTVHKYSTK